MKHTLHAALLAAPLLVAMAPPTQSAVVAPESFEVAFTVFVPCANNGVGELVDLAGTMHAHSALTSNPNGVVGQIHINARGVSGFGQITGESYLAVGGQQDDFRASLQNDVWIATLKYTLRVIGQGGGSDFLMHFQRHVTYNAAGALVADHVEPLETRCRP